MEELIFFLGLFFLSLLPPMDPDLGWHLRCGELILKGQDLCSKNKFSSLLAGYNWTNHHWLYQAFLFFIWKNFGFWGLSILSAIIVTLTFMILNLMNKKFRLEKKWVIILTLFLSWGIFHFGVRSQLLGILYFSLVLLSLVREEILPRYFLPLIFLLWANTHGSVILGLAFLFLFSFKNLKEKFRHYFSIFFFSFLATLTNPFGVMVLKEAWQHFAGVPLEKLIAEWVPPGPLTWILVFLSGVFLISLSQPTLWPVLTSFTFLGLKARRNLPFFFILFFTLLLKDKSFKNWLAPWLKKKSLRNDLLSLTSLMVFFYSLFVRLPQTFKINASWENYCQASTLDYPYKAVAFLKTQPEKGLPAGKAGNLFNRYEWGGFLIWTLPEYKVFVDGRMPAWPVPPEETQGRIISPYTIYLETLQTQPGWQETLDRYNINWILISPNTFMDLKLKPNPEEFGWDEVYRDQISVVYKRTN